MRPDDDIRRQVNEVQRYLGEELGEASPIDRQRLELLALGAEQVHHLRNAEPTVETSTGVKGNPDHKALQYWAGFCRGVLKDVEAPVLAKRAAEAAARQPEGLTPTDRALQQMQELERMPPS